MAQNNQMHLYDSNGAEISVTERGRLLVDPITGEEVYLQAIHKHYYGERHFWKIFLLDFLAVLGIIESKQLDVVVYIMEHTSPYNNQFQGTQRTIASKLGVSVDTVSRTFKKLLSCNFIAKTDIRGVYRINPGVMMQGSAAKQRGLMIQYTQSEDKSTIAEAAEMNALPDTIQPEPIQTPAEVLNAEDNGR